MNGMQRNLDKMACSVQWRFVWWPVASHDSRTVAVTETSLSETDITPSSSLSGVIEIDFGLRPTQR